jgi:cell division protein ZapE
LGIREAYRDSLLHGGHSRDAAQEIVVGRLADLQERLRAKPARKSGFLERFLVRGAQNTPVKGIYLWGGVGRGKTFLMDLFFETLDVEEKTRIHFHRMMRDVHARLGRLGDLEDPLDRVAADIAAETRVLCFDEFFVSDIGDAMILAKLLEGLFDRGVTIVATSNSRPEDLYKDGLQRQRFLPAIDLVKKRTHVMQIGGDVDYRLRLLQQAGTYLAPEDAQSRQRLQHYFDESASSQITADHTLDINGREIRTHLSAKGIAWFEFEDICGGPRSQNDYIEIARWYPTIIVSSIPVFGADRDDEARRFIALVDEFYDRRVKLIVSAAAQPADLYTGKRLAFDFERTRSRLVEMQSADYLAAPHLA